MSQFTQQFFVEGRYLGEAPRSLIFAQETPQPPIGYVFFCPVCGELWAVCPVVKANGSLRGFFAWTRLCRKHPPSGNQIPGSIWITWEEDFIKAFPRDVLLREFELHSKLLPEVL